MDFERELAFHRFEYGLEPLADTAGFPEPERLIFSVGPDQFGAEFVGDEGSELGACGPHLGDNWLPPLRLLVDFARWC